MNLEAAMKPYLDQFQDELNKYLLKREWAPKELYDAVRHMPLAPGAKRLRPLVGILATQAVGGDAKKILPFSVALELLHSFTLVHDDIMDVCDTRRGVETVHKKFGNNLALLAGDTLFSMVFEHLASLDVDGDIYKVVQLDVARLAREVCEGQYWDMHYEKEKKVEELEYYHMIERKTATFFETAMRNGATLASGDPAFVKKLAECGRLMGLAFQAWDDYLGVTAGADETGKDSYSDIRNSKKTLPYVSCHANLDSFDRRIFVDLYRKAEKTPEDMEKILAFLKKSGGIEYTRDRAKKFSSYAKANLAELPETAAKRMLGLICDHASNRTH